MAFADHDIDPGLPAYYAGSGDGGGDSDDAGAVVVFRFTPRTDGSGVAASEQEEAVTSHTADPGIGWTDPEGIQAVAQAVLRHYTGHEPDQAALEALTMDQGDDWAANSSWTLTVEQLERIL